MRERETEREREGDANNHSARCALCTSKAKQTPSKSIIEHPLPAVVGAQ